STSRWPCTSREGLRRRQCGPSPTRWRHGSRGWTPGRGRRLPEMGKFDELMRSGAANMAESVGVGVGRGPGSPPAHTSTTPARGQGVSKSKTAVESPVENLHRDPNQPREEFDEAALARLAESIRTRGQLQPIRVRWDEGRGTYVIIAGERRWRAARMA